MKKDTVKRVLTFLLLVWPAALIALYSLTLLHERRQIDKEMDEAHGFAWQTGEDRFVVHTKHWKNGELEHIELEVTGPGNIRLIHTKGVIDWDMFGGGFVKAMQADKDADKEIVFWGGQRNSFFLDFTGSDVVQIPFDRAAPEARELAGRWHQLNQVGGLEISIMVIFAAAYYVLLGSVTGVAWLVRRSKIKRQSTRQPSPKP